MWWARFVTNLSLLAEKMDVQPHILIKIFRDRTKSILTVEDFGIGVMKNEVVNNFGTIAKVG